MAFPASWRTPRQKDGVDLINARPVRHPWRYVIAIVILYIAVCVVDGFRTNENFHWDVVGEYLFDRMVIKALGWTLLLTVVAMALGIVLAVALALMRQSANPLAKWVANLWIWFFRGTPVYTQLLFWGLVATLYPTFTIGLPFGGPTFVSFETQKFYSAAVAAILGLGLNESAYLAEIFRAGFQSLPKGQFEAAASLGLPRRRTMWNVILPQAMRVIIPPTGNELIGMLKSTSLVLAVPFTFELTYVTNSVANRLYLPVPMLMVAAIWYIIITSVLMVGQHFLEKKFGKGVSV
ncbi:amino acid ABC transporter permease [Brevibacterium moorei]|uniref:amino acid ABC transporter permease n=1 Tax=Brevibacterium moorei TaxID=2968457 RepID=UPI00211C6C18|nr:amino acid ABC transporter permease [Brevibacterium sp. 68QC2CO]MCQ9385369.1 amino acid ABC transporter permease [Brevibacterium sp. 68QC2CO]